jgi:hypothetical protein
LFAKTRCPPLPKFITFLRFQLQIAKSFLVA